MFGSKPPEPRTVADAIILKTRLVFTCRVCGAVTSKEPSIIFFEIKMDLKSLEAMSTCAKCGANNISGYPARLVLTLGD